MNYLTQMGFPTNSNKFTERTQDEQGRKGQKMRKQR